jgi:hypothetical protein
LEPAEGLIDSKSAINNTTRGKSRTLNMPRWVLGIREQTPAGGCARATDAARIGIPNYKIKNDQT